MRSGEDGGEYKRGRGREEGMGSKKQACQKESVGGNIMSSLLFFSQCIPPFFPIRLISLHFNVSVSALFEISVNITRVLSIYK